jgi:NAD(P)-dependent dehydrogenase (short-subunit alcohol dehydrogenase family)
MRVNGRLIGSVIGGVLAARQERRRSEREAKGLMLAAAGIGAALAVRAIIARRQAYDLQGKVVLITGGSRGLGLVLAREMIREGARVAICGRNPESLERAAEDLRRRGGDVLAIRCDISDRDRVEDMVAQVNDHFGRLDVLVNNAGIITVGPAELMTIEDYKESMKINFWGALYTSLAALPGMRTRGEGRIVNISSIGGRISVPHMLPYSASKFALAGLSEGMRAEFKKDGVVVTTVFPGLMRTGSPRNADFKGQHRDEYSWFVIGDSSPLTSISAESAAHQIIESCRRGEAEAIISPQAQAAIRFKEMFPELTSHLTGFVNRLLPAPGGIGTTAAKGRESYSSVSRSFLTALDQAAARSNNQIA